MKHKWWEHLIFKYKTVENKEYERFRNWFIILIFIGIILASPIIVIVYLVKNAKYWFTFPDGRYGYEKYSTYIKKEIDKK